MGSRRPSPGVALLGFFFTFALYAQHCVNALDPGGRKNACFFTFNNTLYIFGGWRPDKTSNPFLSTPLPVAIGVTRNWTPVPMPPEGQAWGDSLNPDQAPQIDCASTKNGKVFFFGGPAGFASFNLVTNQWDVSTQPAFGSGNANFANLKDQTAVKTATHPDGTTISIVTATAYLKFDSISNTIDGMRHKMEDGLFGLCLTVIPDLDLPVACGGTFSQRYLDGCLSFSTTRGPTTYGLPMPWAQGGCLLLPHKSGIFLVPGYLASYWNNSAPIDNTINPPIHFLSGSSQPWVNITNLNTGMFTVRTYAQSLVLPGTSIAVIYGGSGPWGTYREELHIIDLAKQTWLSRVDPNPGAFISPSPAAPKETSAIVGGSIGAVVVVALIAGLAYFIVRRRKRARVPNPEESTHPSQNLHDNSNQGRTNNTIIRAADTHRSPQSPEWIDIDQSKSTVEPNSSPVQFAPAGGSSGRRVNTVQDTNGLPMVQSMYPPRDPQLASDPRNCYL